VGDMSALNNCQKQSFVAYLSPSISESTNECPLQN
jgi:hypothetical protein